MFIRRLFAVVLLGSMPVSTQIYTRVEIGDLKAVHRRFHPRERGSRRWLGSCCSSTTTAKHVQLVA